MWLANSQEDFYRRLEPMDELAESMRRLLAVKDNESFNALEIADLHILANAYCRTFITARIKLRNDHGPDGTLSDPQEFVLIDGLYYRKAWIQSGQGLRREQLEVV